MRSQKCGNHTNLVIRCNRRDNLNRVTPALHWYPAFLNDSRCNGSSTEAGLLAITGHSPTLPERGSLVIDIYERPALKKHEGHLKIDLVILNRGRMTIPELVFPTPNFHTTPKGGRLAPTYYLGRNSPTYQRQTYTFRLVILADILAQTSYFESGSEDEDGT
ncbi:hypothetical protein AVEN_133656-1 [Araneus ventricosus]|uniref:Uncharacterized protein n=1 Tax=Araneus ventricosus TaxID=182803 RepID=A0A4Y2MP56_ARAVE|nr:hypothetical protein AVEN_133656-1 [Araneus ventricosus]